MKEYEDWLDDLNAELHKRGIRTVEELHVIGVITDAAAMLAQWFEIDRCGHFEVAARIAAIISQTQPSAA